ncbi:MAG: PadR family transcriptional regulator [Solirubrobacterales bacterium]|nr:PadR family transcriptional regulator [Solirubrobacterales bacterium]
MGMSARATREAVSDVAPLEAARAAAGAKRSGATAGGAGPRPADPLVGELRRGGLLPLLVLHFLAGGNSYGNQLMERVATATGGLLKVNQNTMYPLLRQLENEGLIAGEWEHPERRSRRFYRLTEAGERQRDELRADLGPRLDAVARGVELVRAELDV